VKRALERERYDLLICDFLSSTLNVPRPCPCPTILFQHNVEARIWQRHLETQSHWLRRLYLRSQWARLVCYERTACSDFDHVVAVSAEDRDYFQQEYGLTAVSATPTGVDVEFFRPQGAVEHPHHLVFTGGMDWLPNEDAMQYFADHVWPQVRQAVPDATLSIVGRTPTAKVQRLAERPGITVTGRVPDVRPYIDEAAVYIVPLRVGGGTRLKIYEAMAIAKPVVSTRVGAEGLDVRDGENILLADAPEPFADAVIRLLREPHRRLALGAAARRLVEHRYSWERVVEQFETVCLETIGRKPWTSVSLAWAM
jgi:glycosyltransferase involved in cell wall biosynthesis